jgi:hypothetical protein
MEKFGDMKNRLGARIQRKKNKKIEDISGIGSRSFMTMCVYLFLLLFTCIILFLRVDSNKSFYLSRMVYETFDEGFKLATSIDSVYAYIRNSVGIELLEGADGSLPQLRDLSYMVGPIRIRQLRSKKTE